MRLRKIIILHNHFPQYLFNHHIQQKPTWFYVPACTVKYSVLTIYMHLHGEHYSFRQCVCQGIAMLWAAYPCESLSLGAIDRPLGPAGTQGSICSTECVILSQQACHSSNHSNTHSFLEFRILRLLKTIKELLICLVSVQPCIFDS